MAGDPVASDCGNDIRDRTVQRYADATARDAAVPLPIAGDLAWLDSPGVLTVFDGTVWLTLAVSTALMAYLDPGDAATLDVRTGLTSGAEGIDLLPLIEHLLDRIETLEGA